MVTYSYAARATIGARQKQEDAVAVWPTAGALALDVPGRDTPAGDGFLAVLADGMGGHAAGALASRIVCERFVDTYAGADGGTRERLMLGLGSANDAIAAKVDDEPQLDGMGSTVIGAAFGPEGLEWVSVGDSPMYLLRRGEIATLNEDHSLAPALDMMAEQGKITREQALRDPRRHMLRSAVTGEDLELIDVSRKPLALEPGDTVILASDGIHTLPVGEIARIASAYADGGPAAIAGALIRAVETGGDPYQDNTTILVVRPR